ncbi:MAG: hypothetical protein ACD_73C00596G0001 [uncultured bacterium]|nr:MAG: hypothetical protein ACD_73C00596G0001 [uncultured bacterium]
MTRLNKIALLLLIALAIGLLINGFLQKRIEPNFGNNGETQNYRVGKYKVFLYAKSRLDGDSGPVDIIVSVNGTQAGTIASHFNYDTLMDLPAGYTYYRWIDDDLYRDLVIDPHSSQTGRSLYFIGSQDGKLKLK